MILLYQNNAKSTVAAPIGTGSLTVTVAPGDGAKFPNPNVGTQYFKVSFVDAATKLLTEICNCTQRVGDVLTIVRAQENTTARTWGAGDTIANFQTAGSMSQLAQIEQAQQSAFNASIDTGSLNSYVAAFSPPITVRSAGMTLRIKASSSNNGPSTLNVGAGSAPLINPDGSALGSGAVVNGGYFEVVDDGTSYQLISASQELQSNAGLFTTGGFQWRPTSESLSGWVVANATTIGNAASNATQLANASAANLFAWHWNNFSNTQCPVFTSGGVPTTRGANAAADFAANKQIQVYDMRGTGQIGVDTMGGAASTRLTGVPVVTGSATAPGSVLGENLHQLVLAEIPSHQHAVFLKDNQHQHGQEASPGGGVSGMIISPVSGVYTGPFAATALASSNITIGSVNGTANDNQTAVIGGGGSHNNVERSAAGYYYIKL